jgi:DNA-binding beta-propeller fold protein YncE
MFYGERSVVPKCLRDATIVVIALLVIASPSLTQDQTLPTPSIPYHLVENWFHVPSGQPLGTIAGIDFDSKGIAYVFRRCAACGVHPKGGDPPGIVWMFDRNGDFLHEWGREPIAQEAHSLRIDRSGFIWITDTGAHQVKKFQPDGTLVMTLGKYGVPGDGPDTFNMPTDVVVAPNGDFFVSDGYGNQRVVKFNKEGKFIKAWGGKGTGPGQFRLPHSIVQDSRGRLIVADRCGLTATRCTGDRIEIFDTDGKFLDQWTNLGGVSLYITRDDTLYVGVSGRIFIADVLTGKVRDVIEKTGPNHEISVDQEGNIYSAQLAAGLRRYAPAAVQ